MPLVLTAMALLAPTLAYDPLAVSGPAPKFLDMTVRDAGRKREIPMRAYMPLATSKQPVILFSHGLGGNREGNTFSAQHWAKRGYVVVHLQHPGSDESVWKDVPLGQRMTRMRSAANGQNLKLRVDDVASALNQLEKWNSQAGHPLYQRMDLSKVGMSGHSFGAVTTQAVSGQSFPGIGNRFTDKRIDAALAFSPNHPTPSLGKTIFREVSIPWMLMTGTNDTAIIGGATVESRLAVYPNLPTSIDRFQLVLFEAEHSAFNDQRLPGDKNRRNPNHHRSILAASTAFWDTYLRGNAEARSWLVGSGMSNILEPKDKWLSAVASQN